MAHFFVDPTAVCGDRVTLTGENAHHAAYALRLAVGDTVTVSDQRQMYVCVLRHFSEGEVVAEVQEIRTVQGEPPYCARLFQALPKGDKLDTIIQKAVECGVSEIIPFESSRCIMRSKPETELRKTQRRLRIAEEAAKQCRRSMIPTVCPTVTEYEAVLQQAALSDLTLFCYEGTGTRSLRAVLDSVDLPKDRGLTVSIIVGSEGGFSPEEAQAAADAGLCLCGLGARILRTETASGFVLGCLSYRFEL